MNINTEFYSEILKEIERIQNPGELCTLDSYIKWEEIRLLECGECEKTYSNVVKLKGIRRKLEFLRSKLLIIAINISRSIYNVRPTNVGLQFKNMDDNSGVLIFVLAAVQKLTHNKNYHLCQSTIL